MKLAFAACPAPAAWHVLACSCFALRLSPCLQYKVRLLFTQFSPCIAGQTTSKTHTSSSYLLQICLGLQCCEATVCMRTKEPRIRRSARKDFPPCCVAKVPAPPSRLRELRAQEPHDKDKSHSCMSNKLKFELKHNKLCESSCRPSMTRFQRTWTYLHLIAPRK